MWLSVPQATRLLRSSKRGTPFDDGAQVLDKALSLCSPLALSGTARRPVATTGSSSPKSRRTYFSRSHSKFKSLKLH